MDKKTTQRGFGRLDFVDRYGESCSLQESSLAEEACIWLGVDNPKVRAMSKELLGYGVGWVDVPIPECAHIIPNRMHLTQDMVKELIPHLQRFAETGEL